MANERGIVVGSVLGSPSVLVSEPGAAIKVIETKLTGRLLEGLTADIEGFGAPRRHLRRRDPRAKG